MMDQDKGIWFADIPERFCVGGCVNIGLFYI
jgi:hypothetical protein